MFTDYRRGSMNLEVHEITRKNENWYSRIEMNSQYREYKMTNKLWCI